MTAFTAEEVERQALWEKLNAITGKITEKADRLLLGDEAYDYSHELAAEVRQLEHAENLRKYRLAVALSRRNRGETP